MLLIYFLSLTQDDSIQMALATGFLTAYFVGEKQAPILSIALYSTVSLLCFVHDEFVSIQI